VQNTIRLFQKHHCLIRKFKQLFICVSRHFQWAFDAVLLATHFCAIILRIFSFCFVQLANLNAIQPKLTNPKSIRNFENIKLVVRRQYFNQVLLGVFRVQPEEDIVVLTIETLASFLTGFYVLPPKEPDL